MKTENKIVLVEPSPIIRAGIENYLIDNHQFKIAYQLDDLEQLEMRLITFEPSILIINPLLTSYSAAKTFAKLCHEHPSMIPVAIVTTLVDKSLLAPFCEVIELTDGKHKVISKLLKVLREKNPETVSYTGSNIELSEREKDVLIALVKGKTNKEISDELCISPNTVITHRKNIIRKTGIKSVAALAIFALLKNWVDEADILQKLF